jgi:hypothetical protein
MQKVEQNSFIKGLITEATPLTFPDNASIIENNFILNRDGSRQRRLGMITEDEALSGFSIEDIEPLGISTFEWSNVSEDPTKAYGVTQIGSRLWFCDLNSELQGSIGYINIVAATPSTVFHYASLLGYLIVVSGDSQYTVVQATFDINGDPTFSVHSRETLRMRDFQTVDDGTTPYTLDNSIDLPHYYNLYNQGWAFDPINTSNDPVKSFMDSHNRSPWNTEIGWIGINKADSNNFKSSLIKGHHFGTTYAPKGFFVIDIFNRGISRTIELDKTRVGTRHTIVYPQVLPRDYSEGGLIAIESFAGRAWYANNATEVIDGDKFSPKLGTFVFFSQVISNIDNLKKCYQEGDPSAEDDNQLVATDGGFVRLPEAKNITRLVAVSSSLLVLAENGVWEITGSGDAVGFAADNFQVRRVSANGVLSPQSAVTADASVFYMSKAGIYAIAQGQSGVLESTNITQSTIQRLYDEEIDPTVRAHAVGTYDQNTKTIRWLYNDKDDPQDPAYYNGVTYTKRFNKELVFDISLSAFYVLQFSQIGILNTPWVAGYIRTTSFNNANVNNPVVVDGEGVVVDTEDVGLLHIVRSRGNSSLKYLTFEKSETQWDAYYSWQKGSNFIDWEGKGDAAGDALATLVTGYLTAGDAATTKTSKYLKVHCERTENGYNEGMELLNQSSCIVQAQWGFTDDVKSNRWGAPFEAYKLLREYLPSGPNDPFDYGFKVITTKNVLKGKGDALSLKFQTSPGKDLKIYGWNYYFGGYD